MARGRAAWRRKLIEQEGNRSAVEQGELHSAAMETAFRRALERYEVRSYDGIINLFRPKLRPIHVFGPGRQIDVHRRFIFEDNGWSPFCQRVEISEVPGDHDSMVLEPNVRVLADRMRSAIGRAEAASAGMISVADEDSADTWQALLKPIVIDRPDRQREDSPKGSFDNLDELPLTELSTTGEKSKTAVMS
jgi:hypothetical protein